MYRKKTAAPQVYLHKLLCEKIAASEVHLRKPVLVCFAGDVRNGCCRLRNTCKKVFVFDNRSTAVPPRVCVHMHKYDGMFITSGFSCAAQLTDGRHEQVESYSLRTFKAVASDPVLALLPRVTPLCM